MSDQAAAARSSEDQDTVGAAATPWLKIKEKFVNVKIAVAVALFTVAASVPATAGLPAHDSDSGYYENVDYQFSVKLPSGKLACVGEHTNHGVVILLDAHPACDDRYDGLRAIYVVANYNTATEARTPWRLARIECRYRPSARIVWLGGVTLGGRKAAGCRRYFKGNKVSVEIMTLRKTEPWAARWIQVGAELATTVDRYESDMRIFRGVLKTVWIHPDGPDD